MKGATPPPGFLLRHPAHLYALGFGTGLAPRAPGTFGTLVALPIAWTLWRHASPSASAMIVIVLALVGVWAATVTGRDLGVPDHGAIVCDEFVAYLLVLLFTGPDLPMVIAGFALFRLFDITKPWPIRALDRRWKTGMGVMADDLVAAGYTIAALVLLRRVFA